MRVDVLQVTRIILFACKPTQPLLVDIDTKRVDRGDGDVNTKVPLEFVNEQRIRNVLLDDARLLACTARHLIKAADDLDSLALARRLGLHNPELFGVLAHLSLQLLVLLRAVER